MPVYTYRREDGTTFDIQQKFLDDPLTQCPTTGQPVVRIIQSPGIIFKGSGFYVTDNKGKSSTKGASSTKPAETTPSAESKTADSKPAETTTEAKKAG